MEKLTEKQQGIWDLIYKSTHDERHLCDNVITLIDLDGESFPEDHPIAVILPLIRSYFQVRSELGKNCMDLLYKIKEIKEMKEIVKEMKEIVKEMKEIVKEGANEIDSLSDEKEDKSNES